MGLLTKSALQKVYEKQSYYGQDKHIFNEKIIKKYSNSSIPNDILAVAISHLGEGAENRKYAIEYFEKYLTNPSSQQYYDLQEIYASLATLYEKEYLFDKAIKCFNILIELNNKSNPEDYISIGKVLVKIDIDRAIKYYENLHKEKIYIIYKDVFDKAYNDVLIKKQKGYVYRPRKKIK